MSVMNFPLVSRGVNYVTGLDREKVMMNAAAFAAGHMGCVMTPVIAAMSSGAVGANVGLLGAMTFSSFTTLGFDTWLQDTKPENCMRCVTSKLTGFKRQGKLLVQAMCMGALAHFGMQGSHEKVSESTVQTLADGRQYTLKNSVLCGVKTIVHKTDTQWVQQPKGIQP